MTVFLLIVAVLIIILTGFLFLQIFDNPFKKLDFTVIFSFSWLTGIVVISYSSLLVLFAGFWGLNQNILIILFLPVLLFLVFYKRIWQNILEFKKDFKFSMGSNIIKKDKLIYLNVLILIIIYAFLILFYNIKAPISFWDGFMIWGLKTKLIFYNMMDINYFKSKDYFFSQLDYPLLFPLIQAFISKFIGFYDERLNRIIFGITLFSFIFILHYFITRFFKDILSLLVISPFLLMGVFLLTWLNSSADTILMTYYLTVIITIYLYLLDSEQNNKLLILASISILGCLMTKNEGLLYVLSLILIAFLYTFFFIKDHKAGFKNLFLCFALPFLFNLPWIIFIKANGIINVEGFSLLTLLSINSSVNFNNVIKLLKLIITENIMNTANWGLTFYLFFMLLFYGLIFKRFKEITYFAGIFFLNLFGLVFVYLHSPYDIFIHLNTSLSRVLLSMIPLVICYIIVVSVKRTQDKEELILPDYLSKVRKDE